MLNVFKYIGISASLVYNDFGIWYIIIHVIYHTEIKWKMIFSAP